ncbi:MAG: sulfotransferase family protein [Planctomycetota bacterium]
MALKVLGAGFGRTGTKSLQKALEILGIGRCHHMFEMFRKPRQAGMFLRATENGGIDWEEVFDGYQAAVDWPSAFFWRELTERYPSTRVILTVRDEQRWYESISKTILPALLHTQQKAPPAVHMHERVNHRIIFDLTFRGRLADREFAISRFQLHNEQVRSEVDPNRLLVYNVAEGWGPLCRLLDRPLPKTPFPVSNTRSEFPLFLSPLQERRSAAPRR